MPNRNVKIITCQRYHGRGAGSMGSSVLRGDWLIDAWPELSYWRTGAYADAMIFQKVYWKYMLDDFQGVKILDLCDPDWMGGELKLVEVSKKVDAITCSCDGLTDFVKKIVKDKPVITIPDRLNLNWFTQKRQHTVKAGRVVWFGYHHNAEETISQVFPALAHHGLELLVVSNKPFVPSKAYGIRVQNIKWNPSTAYQSIQFADFAVNPQLITAHWRYKSNNKTLVAWGLGLPVAERRVDFDRFIDPVERQKEIDVRTKEIEEKWDIKYSVEQFKNLIDDIYVHKLQK